MHDTENIYLTDAQQSEKLLAFIAEIKANRNVDEQVNSKGYDEILEQTTARVLVLQGELVALQREMGYNLMAGRAATDRAKLRASKAEDSQTCLMQ